MKQIFNPFLLHLIFFRSPTPDQTLKYTVLQPIRSIMSSKKLVCYGSSVKIKRHKIAWATTLLPFIDRY